MRLINSNASFYHSSTVLTDSQLFISKSLINFLEDCDVIEETEDVDSGGES